MSSPGHVTVCQISLPGYVMPDSLSGQVVSDVIMSSHVRCHRQVMLYQTSLPGHVMFDPLSGQVMSDVILLGHVMSVVIIRILFGNVMSDVSIRSYYFRCHYQVINVICHYQFMSCQMSLSGHVISVDIISSCYVRCQHKVILCQMSLSSR
jgi:hypothetical protein